MSLTTHIPCVHLCQSFCDPLPKESPLYVCMYVCMYRHASMHDGYFAILYLRNFLCVHVTVLRMAAVYNMHRYMQVCLSFYLSVYLSVSWFQLVHKRASAYMHIYSEIRSTKCVYACTSTRTYGDLIGTWHSHTLTVCIYTYAHIYV
jgi:hypothetical protein